MKLMKRYKNKNSQKEGTNLIIGIGLSKEVQNHFKIKYKIFKLSKLKCK